MSEPSDELKAFAAVKGWPVTTRDDGRLYCTGRERGVRCFAWTADPALGPLLTIVLEVKSGLRFDVVAGPKVQPGAFEFETVTDAEGQPRLVRVRDLAPSVRSWLQTLDPAALAHLALQQGEKLAVHLETIAITFPTKDLVYTMGRFDALLEFAAFLPKRRAHALPGQLRPIAGLVRKWSISDDARRQARVAAARTEGLQEVAIAWRQHVELIKTAIAARHESSLSARLTAFSEAAMEAEQELLRRREGGDPVSSI